MITLTRKIHDEMIAHAKAGYPNEACGILAGKKEGEGSIFFPMKNTDESAISYFMEPKEQLQVFKRMRELNLVMTGIFHSHVASVAYPSQKDVRLAYYPEASYLIVSLSHSNAPNLRSYKIVDEKVTEEEIRLT
jgi:proteasome lid subunit RPN8/RPN11